MLQGEEARSQKQEVRSQKCEVRRQKSEDTIEIGHGKRRTENLARPAADNLGLTFACGFAASDF